MPRTLSNPSFSPQARPSCFSKAGATNKAGRASEEAKERNDDKKTSASSMGHASSTKRKQPHVPAAAIKAKHSCNDNLKNEYNPRLAALCEAPRGILHAVLLMRNKFAGIPCHAEA
jgi:hypothetical protein